MPYSRLLVVMSLEHHPRSLYPYWTLSRIRDTIVVVRYRLSNNLISTQYHIFRDMWSSAG
jgi:hypothetical protein